MKPLLVIWISFQIGMSAMKMEKSSNFKVQKTNGVSSKLVCYPSLQNVHQYFLEKNRPNQFILNLLNYKKINHSLTHCIVQMIWISYSSFCGYINGKYVNPCNDYSQNYCINCLPFQYEFVNMLSKKTFISYLNCDE